jgi:hypothetical protein
MGCRRPTRSRRSSIGFIDRDDDDRNRLDWKWSNGQDTPLFAFGDPATFQTTYSVCLYDASLTAQPVMASFIKFGSWGTFQNGYTFRAFPPNFDGITLLQLRAGVEGKAKFKLKARAGAIPLPLLPLTPPVRVQLQASNDECWEATFSSPSRNGVDGRFKASSD